MKKILFRNYNKFYVLLILLLTAGSIKASHFYGADFFYTHVSGNTYTVTLVVYGDCTGSGNPSSAFSALPTATPGVDVFNGSSLYTTTTLVIQTPSAGVEVTPVCPSQLNNTNCTNSSSTIPGVRKFVYSRNITLNTTSANWKFLFTGTMGTTAAGRSNSITNITISSLNGSVTQLEATLNNVNSSNSSPVYTTIPTPFFSINKAASYNPGTVDPNGDSLSYGLVPGLTPTGTVSYINPYTATAPLASATGSFNFSNTTGQLNFTPNQLQRSLVVNRVSEYRNGTLVGTSMREMTFVVLNSNNRPPLGTISNASGGNIINSSTISICKSSGFLSFQINPSDSDGNTINVAWSGIPAGATFNVTNNNTTAPLGSFSWNLASVTPGTYNFFVTYTDNGCPLSSKQTQAYTITILPDPTIISYTSISPATCTKKAKYSITPGVGSPWTLLVYQGSTIIHTLPNITTTQVDSLSPGTYTLRLRNSNNCYKDTLITIAPPPAIIPSVALVQPNCYGDTNGRITLAATGGLAPFKYAIGAGAYTTNNVFNNLYSGTYMLHIRDSNDCIKDTSVFLQQPTPVNASISFTQPPCNFFNSGVITVAGVNGVSPYQYALGSGSFSSANTFSGLYSGTYILHIKDAKGCLKDSTFLLPDSVKVHANAILTHILCNGDSTGIIALNAFGATAPYSYKLGSGTPGSTNTFTNLPAITHNFHIEDSNKCYLDTIITLTEPQIIKINPTVTNVLCYGESNGSVIINSSGGVNPYTYAVGTGSYTSNNNFNGLPTGTYTFHVKDNNNCVRDTSFMISQPNRFVITAVSMVTPSCYGYANGTFTLSASGGTSPYTYALNAGSYQSSNFFNSLNANVYNVHFKDANNCLADTTVTLSEPTPVAPLAQLKNSTCTPLNDGIVTLSGTGGSPGYTYALGSGSYSTSPSFSALSASTYTFHVKDNRGCVKDTMITVIDSLVVSGSANVTDAKCYKDSTGSIGVISSGGVNPYTYSLASGPYQSSNTFLNLPAGNHAITIKDNLGCLKAITASVGEPAVIVPNATIKNISCYGLTDGSITFLPAGGTPPYSYAMGNGPYSPGNVISNISVGLYLYHVKDDNGCIHDTILHVKQPLQITMTVAASNNLCHGDSSGIVTVNGNGGVPPYSYYANSGVPQSSNIITGLKAGSHVIYMEDTNHCKASQFVNLSQPTRLLIDKAVVTHPTCEGFVDGSVIVSPKGGTSPYLFSINGSPPVSGTEFKYLGEGNYNFLVTDSNGCSYDTSIMLKGFPHIFVDEVTSEDVKCFGSHDGKIIVDASGGVPPLRYHYNTKPPVDNNVLDGLYAGTYNIIIIDSMNCKLDTTVTIGSPDKLNIQITATPNDCEGYDNNGRIRADVTGGTPPYTYSWSTNPVSTGHELSGMANGKYFVSILDANACKDSAIADIAYNNCCKISIPDAFTPNGDGKNDKIKMIVKGDFKLKLFAIYNRFGQKVFSTDIINGYESDGWDGILNGVIQDIGTYNYYAIGTCGNKNAKEVEYKGTIMLIK